MAKSVDNFKNFVFEQCKLKKIMKDKILIYLFLLDDFRKDIINAIYYSAYYYNKKYYNYDNIMNNRSRTNEFDRKSFDKKFYNFWVDNKTKEIKDKKKNNKNKELNIKKYNKNKEDIINNKNINENNIDNQNEIQILKEENIEINLIKYDYFGPNEIQYNYVLNEINNDKVTLISPNFLIAKGFSKEYYQSDFQVYNDNNECINIFKYMLNDAIQELNNSIQNKNNQNNNININEDDDIKVNSPFNEKMINEVDIMEFNDKSVGLILSILNPSRYYEIKNLYEQLVADNTKEYKIEQIEYTCSNSANNITIKEDNKINQKQDFYINYNSFVNEEQIANAIVSSINDDFFNQDIERLPRVIFYTNLFIFKSPDGKEKISLIKKQKNYGFDEADGTFYINNNDVTINKNNNVPFIKSMSYDLYNKKENSRIIYYKQNETNSEIILKKNSFVYMESKNSFPLKFDDKTDEPKKENIEDFSKLVRNMIRKSIKFCEIATKKGKEVNQIHILLFYDHIILNDERTKIVIDELQNNFTKAYFKLEKKTKFEVIFFVNPSTINITKFSRSIAKKIEEMEKKNNDKINKLEMKNKQIEDDNRLKIEEMEKKNNQIIEQLNKEKNENNDKINELEKKNKQIEDNNRLKMEEIEKKNKELLAQLNKEKNEKNNKIIEIEKKNKQIEDNNKLQIEEIERKNK